MSSQSTQGANSTSIPSTLLTSGPPYFPLFAILGEHPTVKVDDPIGAIILFFFIVAAIFNVTIYLRNAFRSHHFFTSFLLFIFCMARVIANILRISWASRLYNVKIIIAYQVFLNAGVVMLFVINLFLTQRLFRAYHPHIGWSKPMTIGFKVLYASITADITMVIVALVYSFFTRDLAKLSKVRDVQRTGATYFAVVAFLPLPITALCVLLPRKGDIEKFGQGRMRTKVRLIVFAAVLLSIGAGFRAGIALMGPRLSTNPAWYHRKACFYVFTYAIELVVVYTYILFRIDRRFHVPDGSSGPGHYSASVGSTTFNPELSSVNTEVPVTGNGEQSQAKQVRSDEELESKAC
ncbi:hypothetical protein BGZ61DRAFT_425046 [Ilyonectria robusta]|uniref:uncharacterized protein n=1 Tax=Ilyonectria robusta TaxID=1079257 RepID=UPI001E8E673C|nr:uncharacterized protein BGZ61DRAFT_425046 [Ilyonectria robusta]KAH8683724.1 hypothetical protein BGZ61DRAFT_425046 [Ilyonectria robusta]